MAAPKSVERERSREASRAAQDKPFELVGTSPAMRTLLATIDAVARSSAPALVTGETGAGKELVARAIHAQSSRCDGPFVAVNTAAIPHELLEGELFGHTRGAFTGAAQARKGLLDEADGGTLLLDEIADMSFPLQAKLLRVLQFGDVRPVGGNRTHHVDVRVIASTHRNLLKLIEEGGFREDLYFRLDVLPVHVPPLRDHREDIPALAKRFLNRARQRAPSSPVRKIGPEALRALTSRDWPGNVRELESCIERAVVFGFDESLDVFRAVSHSLGSFCIEAPASLDQVTRAYAQWVLEHTEGDKQRAAAILGVDPSTLYRWRKQWDDEDSSASAHEGRRSPPKTDERGTPVRPHPEASPVDK